MLDALVRGGRVVTADGMRECDVAIRDGTIVGLVPPGAATDGAEIVDATGSIVLPGGIDPHVHSDFSVRRPGVEPYAAGGPEHIGRAALLGGTTTLLDFAVWTPGEEFSATLERGVARWSRSYTDFGHHLLVRGELSSRELDQIPDVVAAGWPSVKVFTSNIRPLLANTGQERPGGRDPRQLRVASVGQLLRRLRTAGGVLAVHAEDDDLVMQAHERCAEEGRTGIAALPEVHSAASEDRAIRQMVDLATESGGSALYVVHVSAGLGAEAIAEARKRGLPIYGETLHHYLAFTSEVYRHPDGALFHTYPSIKSGRDRDELWRHLANGSLNVVATDEVSLPREVKLSGRTVFDAVGGHAGIETRMAVLYTEAVVKRAFSVERLAALTSTNAARIFGLYPRKGTIAVGSDADLVLFDPSSRRRLRTAELHDTDYSIWDGYEVEGWPRLVMLRGRAVVRDGRIVSAPLGTFVPRRIEPKVLHGPVVA